MKQVFSRWVAENEAAERDESGHLIDEALHRRYTIDDLVAHTIAETPAEAAVKLEAAMKYCQDDAGCHEPSLARLLLDGVLRDLRAMGVTAALDEAA